MNYWSFYFLCKVGLFASGYLGLHWGLNLALALAVMWPLSSALWARVRLHLAWPVALVLLYHDSYLPPLNRIWSQLRGLTNFSTVYLMELVARAVNLQALLAFLALLVLYTVLSRYVRMKSLAMLALISVPLVHQLNRMQQGPALPAQTPAGLVASSSVDPSTQLKTFYSQESRRRLNLASDALPAFDIVVLHVCSLSWDDLDFIQARPALLSQQLDVIFRNFNTAASYSGPSSIRVLRGACGQTPHDQLYKAADSACYVFPSLEKVGFHTAGLLNHDGSFDGFADKLEQFGGLEGKLNKKLSAPVQMYAFDGSPIYDDYALLSRWWAQRLTQGDTPVALYYNTISLHDGNRVPGLSSQQSLDTYKPRLTKLLSDFDRFLSVLEKSGRPVVVLLVPEHGASLRGDKAQIAGMREIPGPRVTLTPAAIRLVGLKTRPNTGPIVVDQPVSYFGLFSVLQDLLVDTPYGPDARPLQSRLQQLELTSFVSENEDLVVMRNAAGKYLMNSADGVWLPYQD